MGVKVWSKPWLVKKIEPIIHNIPTIVSWTGLCESRCVVLLKNWLFFFYQCNKWQKIFFKHSFKCNILFASSKRDLRLAFLTEISPYQDTATSMRPSGQKVFVFVSRASNNWNQLSWICLSANCNRRLMWFFFNVFSQYCNISNVFYGPLPY